MLPVFAAFAAVAFAAGRNEITYYGVAALVSGFDVIKGICWYAAVGACAAPRIEDLLPESLFCGTLRNEGCVINLMIHAIRGWVGLRLISQGCDRWRMRVP